MKRFAQFDLIESLDTGGTAAVYLARSPQYSEPIALKVIHPHLIDKMNIEKVEFVIPSLKHPHIIPILENDVFEGRPYLVMPFMAGGSLDKRLTESSMIMPDAIKVLVPIANALDYAHQNQIIHRDIKPANILFDDTNNIYVSDFGIVATIQITTSGGNKSGVFGTADYMSPEQAQSQPFDGRSDQYSLVVMAYEMLSGKRPFLGTDPIQVALKHINDPAPDIRQDNLALSAHVSQVLQKGMAKSPQDRYESCLAFVQALQAEPTQDVSTQKEPNARDVSDFLEKKLTFDELANLIQYDYPDVQHNIALGMTRQQQIRVLMEHVQVEEALYELVAKLKHYHPKRAKTL